MSNLLMLIIAARGWLLCACTQATPVQHAAVRSLIVAYRQPAKADFRLCKDGRVLVFPDGHPQDCN